jgi:phenylacetate-CoA ligase
VPVRWLLGARFRHWAAFLVHAERWNAECIRAYQLAELRRVLIWAAEHSAYYQRVFAARGFDPRALRDPAELMALPTINADTIREHLNEMRSLPADAPGVDVVSTGGTGGRPLRFFINADRAGVEYAHLAASWRRVGYRPGDRMAVLRGRVVRSDRRGLHHEYDPLLRHHYYSAFHLTDADLARYVADMRRRGGMYLHTYPSAIFAMARFIERVGIDPPTLHGVIAESEIVYPEQRALVERVVRARYFACYGHTEKVVLAAECEHAGDYHVWPTYGYFELLDETGRPVTTPGQRGEIVGTGFINYVTPFIRYRTGDFATYVGPRCAACGREHPLIRDIRGHRTQEMLLLSDGSAVSWTALNMHDDTFERVTRFQFRQQAAGRAELRVVPAAGFGDADRAQILEALGRKLEGRLDIELSVVDAIEPSVRGKAIYVDQRSNSALPGG